MNWNRIIGSISEGSCRPEDIVPALVSLAEEVPGCARKAKGIARECFQAWDKGEEYEWDSDAIDELCDLINGRLPEYLYVGTAYGWMPRQSRRTGGEVNFRTWRASREDISDSR